MITQAKISSKTVNPRDISRERRRRRRLVHTKDIAGNTVEEEKW